MVTFLQHLWMWLRAAALVLGLASCSLTSSPPTVVVVPPTGQLDVHEELTHKRTATSATVPSLVWLPFAEGTYDDPPTVLVVRNGLVGRESAPAPIQLFWGYSANSGELAYASQFWHAADGSNQSVSDLWVYDYDDGNISQWLSDYVAAVSWSPTGSREGNSEAAVALFDADNQSFELNLVNYQGVSRTMAEYASRFFSWSPDGENVAFVRQAHPDLSSDAVGLYVVSRHGGEAIKISDFAYQSGGWVGDQPVWVPEYQVILVADNPFRIVSLDGSGDVTPITTDGQYVEGPRADDMLWMHRNRQLVVSGESIVGSAVWAHTLSVNLHIVEHSEFLGEGVLVGWWDIGESVLVMGVDGAQVLQLPGA